MIGLAVTGFVLVLAVLWVGSRANFRITTGRMNPGDFTHPEAVTHCADRSYRHCPGSPEFLTWTLVLAAQGAVWALVAGPLRRTYRRLKGRAGKQPRGTLAATTLFVLLLVLPFVATL